MPRNCCDKTVVTSAAGASSRDAAARLAAGYSKGRNADRVPVDYVEKRMVKTPSGAKPGFVIYTGQTTLFVKPCTTVHVGND